MPTQRIELLQQFYDEDPSDPFNAYALALEYLNYDRDKNRQLFNELLSDHKNYVPTYYHAAKFFQDAGETKKAAEIYESGIALSKHACDQKTLIELKSAYE